MIEKVAPRDIQPGDRVGRLTQDLEIVWVEVEKVTPNKISGRTKSYRVHMVSDVEPHKKAWAEYSHLRAFTVRPGQKVEVQR